MGVQASFRQFAALPHGRRPRALEAAQIGSTAIVEPDRASARTVRPGMVFTLDTGGGKGHAGIVEDVDGARGTLLTLEGNTNNGGSREGYGVFRRRSRKIAMPRLLGYIDYCT